LTDIQLSPGAAGGEANDAFGVTAATISPRKMAFKRYVNHRGALVSTIVLAIIVIFVALAPITARYGVDEIIFKAEAGKPNSNLPPSSLAWFGTTSNGYDLYSRMIYGARVSLMIGLFTGLISVFLGTIVGSIAGLKGGRFDDLVMRATDIMLALPFLVSLIIVRQMLANVSWFTSVFGEPSSIRFLVAFLALLGWMGVSRLIRGQVKQLKEREFIEAARALGASTPRILFRHLLPNAVGQLMVALSFAVIGAITAEATLSFFGFGPDPGSGMTSLGLLIRDSKSAAVAGWWWLVVYPGGLLIIISLCINFIGDGLRDAVDPKMQAGS
jgi:ABC-type dipeptide/oligopeptide/nickel transport system permease subunit